MTSLDGLERPTIGQQLGLFAPPAPVAQVQATVSADRPQLMATLDGLNTRYGRGARRHRNRLECARLGRDKRSGSQGLLLHGWNIC